MTGFQIFLAVIFGIVALFTLVLSIPLKVDFSYDDKINLKIKYLFVKLNILPTDPNKPKKDKKPKEPKKEEPEKEEAPKEPKEKKPNPIIEMVKANGFDGMMSVLGNLGLVLKKYGANLLKSIVFDEAFIDVTVSTGDAASTAIKYGETCQKVFPIMGFICSNNKVKHYDVNVEPDFLGTKSKGKFSFVMNITLRKIINSTFGMIFRLIVNVVLKFIKGGKAKKNDSLEEKTENEAASAVK